MTDVLIEYIHGVILNGRSDVAVGVDEDLLGSGLMDSIAVLQLIRFIESRFKISVPFEDITIGNFGSVSAMSQYLERRNVSE